MNIFGLCYDLVAYLADLPYLVLGRIEKRPNYPNNLPSYITLKPYTQTGICVIKIVLRNCKLFCYVMKAAALIRTQC